MSSTESQCRSSSEHFLWYNLRATSEPQSPGPQHSAAGSSPKICHQPSLSWAFAFRNCVVWFCSWGDVNKCLLTPERELRTEQTRDATRVRVCEPVSFTGVAWRKMGKSYLWERLKVSSSLKTQHSWVTALKVGTCSHLLQGRQPFDVALVSWVSSWKLCLSEQDTRVLTISTCLGREGSSEPAQLQGLPEALTFYFPAGWNVSLPVVKSASSRLVINLRRNCCTAYRKIPFLLGLFYPQASSLPSTSPANLLWMA